MLLQGLYSYSDRNSPCCHWCREFCAPSIPYKPTEIEEVQIVRKRGIDLLHDPLYNKVDPADMMHSQ